MSRLVLGPFNRVEGDLEVQLEVADGRVTQAQVNAPMVRGFENMLQGRDAMDALTIVPRICGICSVSQSVAAAKALGDALGLSPAPNGQHAINLMLGCENLADHLTHFYIFFTPDFTRAAYAGRDWYASVKGRFAAVTDASGGGGQSRKALAARARWMELMGVLGGKWPHTGSVLPGGSSRAIDAAERLRLLVRVREMRQFLEHNLYGSPLEDVLALDSAAALQSWRARAAGSDLACFLDLVDDCKLKSMGPGPGHYLSYGTYTQPDGAPLLAAGVWDDASASVRALDAAQISEDSCHAWLADADQGSALHPRAGQTLPQPDKPGAYTWNKAPRLGGKVVETGAIARQLVCGQPLIRSEVALHGGTVYTRVLARLVELAQVLVHMEGWLGALRPQEPFYQTHPPLQQGEGVGLSEAARGALGHWLRVEHGRIAHYQIVAPTSWNFSPRDAAGQPGALEAALVDAPLDAGEPGQSVAVQHIVRSFDPCMVCTVH